MKQVLSLLELVWRPLRINGAFFIFIYILCIQTKICINNTYSVYTGFSGAETFFELYLVCGVLTLLPKAIRKWGRLLIALLFYVISLIDMFCYVHFDSVLTPTMLMLFFETNGREASEFLDTYIGWDLITSATGRIFFIALLHLLWTLVSDWVKQRMKRFLTVDVSSVSAIRNVMGGNTCVGYLLHDKKLSQSKSNI